MSKALLDSSEDLEEAAIVRHESIIAYSSCSTNYEPLEPITKDPIRVVAESAIVALALIEYWKS